MVEKSGEILASMPYVINKRYGFTYLIHPPLTQNLGPWIRRSPAKYCKMLAEEKDLMQAMICQLPPYDHFQQNWHYSQSNWLPFYWKGFEQTTRYTYVIENLCDLDKVWANFQENIRREIRKAENKFNLEVRTDLPIDEFIELNNKTFHRQGLNVPYPDTIVRKIEKAASQRGQCNWYIAQDKQGNNHAGCFIISDENSSYYLIGGADPDLRNSGASSLCMWKAIESSSTRSRKFDFEGSVIESIERYVRAFGGTQKPYFAISKTPSRFLRTLVAIRKAIR